MPAVAQFEKPEDKQNYLKDVYETVYLKDVLQRNRLKNADGLRELVRILASTMGSSMNALRISNTFKSVSNIEIGTNTISRYLEYLQDSFIISEALRYDVKGRKYIGTETKYYFEDLGIRNAVIGFRQIEFNHTMENVIYNELCRMGYYVDIGLVETFIRDDTGKITRKNLEIDFVVNRHDQRLYIQSAYQIPDEEKLEQELAHYKSVRRIEVAERIKIAIEYGDISENSEYDDAKNEQAFIEGHISELENKINTAKIIDEAVKSDVVSVGSKVTVLDEPPANNSKVSTSIYDVPNIHKSRTLTKSTTYKPSPIKTITHTAASNNS